jgi:hypothetical protein
MHAPPKQYNEEERGIHIGKNEVIVEYEGRDEGQEWKRGSQVSRHCTL